jgi:hypothetical protein
LNLTDYGVIEELRAAYEVLKTSRNGKGMPTNSRPKDGVPLLRRLDCAVIEMLHQLRSDANLDSYDTVFGVFDEGDPSALNLRYRWSETVPTYSSMHWILQRSVRASAEDLLGDRCWQDRVRSQCWFNIPPIHDDILATSWRICMNRRS